jgi:DNA-binding XRE family transcriptional regulator
MSTEIDTVGVRMLTVRSKAGYTQPKMAAILGISEQAYKNYELGKRELPLRIAAKLCMEFNESLDWLVFDSIPELSERNLHHLELVGEASFSLAENDPQIDNPQKFSRFQRKIYADSLKSGTSPKAIGEDILSLFK